MQGTPTGRELLEQASAEVADVERSIREHPFLGALEAGQAPRSALEALAAKQHLIIPSEPGAASRSSPRASRRTPPEPSSCRWPRAKGWRSACCKPRGSGLGTVGRRPWRHRPYARGAAATGTAVMTSPGARSSGPAAHKHLAQETRLVGDDAVYF
jgi:hypothetical protein